MAAVVEFRVVGINSIYKRSAKFRRAADEAPSLLLEYALLVGETVKEIAEKNTPELSGRTRDSYKVTILGSGTQYNVKLENEAPTFHYLLSGHKAFMVVPVNREALTIFGPGSGIFRMWAKIPAVPPNPIMQKTMAEARPMIRIQLAQFKAKMIAMVS